MTKYRVFVQDVGRSGFSGLQDAMAECPEDAVAHFAVPEGGKTLHGQKLIALPHSRKDLWPHPTLGSVPKEALQYR